MDDLNLLNKRKKDELIKELVESPLSPVERNDEGLVIRAYVDYTSYMNKEESKELLSRFFKEEDNPTLSGLKEYLYDITIPYSSSYEYFSPKYLNSLYQRFGRELVYETISEIYLDLCISEILKNSLLDVNLILAHEDEKNVEYTSITNSSSIKDLEETGIGILFKKKNLSLELIQKPLKELKDTLSKENFYFIKEVKTELANIINNHSTLTILLEMSIYEYLTLCEKEKVIEIIYAKAGIVDFFSGGGSLLNMQVEDLSLNTDEGFVDIEIDGCYGYSLDEIYGGINRDCHYIIKDRKDD